ncbi:MAG: pentapeptide repeat-containing protein [Cyanobacteria bacterium P01_F01_bin.42]
MANAEHLELLKQGGEKWNHWRQQNPNIVRINLSNSRLKGFDLSRADLVGVDMSGSDLREADLGGVLLIESSLVKANLRRANLSGAILIGANLAKADLRGAYLSQANLTEAYLSEANLNGVNLARTRLDGAYLMAASLIGANLQDLDLTGVSLRNANLSDANLSDACLFGTNLRGVNLARAILSGLNLNGANLSEANLSEANLIGFDLKGADFCEANLGGADLSRADLSGADLSRIQGLSTNFEQSALTGACLEDWNINSETRFDGVICDYVYLKANQQERRPRDGKFKPGEFAALFQKAVDTIDLIFKDGIDWQAFFQSFQALRDQYADDNLSIQAIERKSNQAFVVRLEVVEGADKKTIESSAKELYESNLVLIEQRYRAELQAKDGEIVAYKEQSANLLEIVKLQASRPINIEATAVADNKSSKYDLSNAQFAGGFAETVQGDQIGGTINNYGPSTTDLTRLLAALRDQAQTFPTDQRDEANDALDLLERDLKEEQPDQARIGRRLKKLVTLGAAIGTIASGAAAVSGDVSTFTGNVIELTEKLGIPIEQVQLPPSGTP